MFWRSSRNIPETRIPSYTVRVQQVVYMIRAFQNYSPKTALTDIELVEGRPAELRGSLCQIEALAAPARLK